MKITKTDIIQLLKEKKHPLTYNEIIKYFDISDKKDQKKLKKHLRELVKKGKILKTKINTFCLIEEANLIIGKIKFTSPTSAKLIPDDTSEFEYIILRPKSIFEALDEDRAIVRIDEIKRDGVPIGTVVEIIERGRKEVVGIFQKNKNFGFVVPLEKKIYKDFYIPPGKLKKAKNGDTVLIKILQYPTRFLNPVGEITKILGKSTDYDTLITSTNLKYGFNEKFSQKTLKYVEKLKESELKTATKKRKDLRHVKFFTIDGEDAKDFDDAVAIEKHKDFYKLYVSIADVEHFVPQNAAIDKDAYHNATSVYYPDRVNPMLPKKLSNNLCSLNPGKDRLSFTVEMDINREGEVINAKFYKSIIKSKFRAMYHKANDVLENADKSKFYKEYLPIYEDLKIMQELAEILRDKRYKDGSIDFDLPETKILLTPKGKVKDVVLRDRGVSDRIIEEFMLIANECVARFISSKDIPMIYRVHEEPDLEKLEKVLILSYNLGVDIDFKNFSSTNIQYLLEKVKGKSFEKLINFLTLRAMKQAKYSPDNIGHFALSKEYYTHFTSPIRRYPDLVNHRILKKVIFNQANEKFVKRLNETLSKIANHCSVMERKAVEAEREVEEIKKIEFMKNRIGEEFLGTITGVTSFGFFVEIDNYLIEGLVPIRNLIDDYYTYVEDEYLLRGKHTGNYYRLGDRVVVMLERVDKLAKEIDFYVKGKIDESI